MSCVRPLEPRVIDAGVKLCDGRRYAGSLVWKSVVVVL